GLFDVPGGGACIAIRRWGDARLIAAGTAAGRGPLRAPPSDAGRRGILELLAHAIELRRVLRAEPAAGQRRLLAMTSTTTTHRRPRIANGRERTFRLNGYLWRLPDLDCARLRGDLPAGTARAAAWPRFGISWYSFEYPVR